MFEGEDDDGPDEPITPYAFPSAVKKSLKDEDEDGEQEDYRFDFMFLCIFYWNMLIVIISKKTILKNNL